MESKNNALFNEVIASCKAKGVYDLMGFRYDWNEEVLCQFWATLFLDGGNSKIYWMTQRIQYSINYKKFGSYFLLPKNNSRKPSIVNEKGFSDRAMCFMYTDPDNALIGSTEGL